VLLDKGQKETVCCFICTFEKESWNGAWDWWTYIWDGERPQVFLSLV